MNDTQNQPVEQTARAVSCLRFESSLMSADIRETHAFLPAFLAAQGFFMATQNQELTFADDLGDTLSLIHI